MASLCVPRRGVPRMTRRLIGLLTFWCVAAEVEAANKRWNVGAGGFSVAGNWIGGVPGPADVAQFGNPAITPPAAYNVSFNVNVTNQALHVEDDFVIFVLNDRLYTVTAVNGIIIGNQSGGVGRLAVAGGTIGSASNINVGAAANATGELVVSTGGLIAGSPIINIGRSGPGTLTIQSGGDISSTGSTTIGVGAGITGNATVNGVGSTLVTDTLNVGRTGIGTVEIINSGLLQNSSTAVVGSSFFSDIGTGTVNVTGSGSIWNSMGLLTVGTGEGGSGGTGEVNITLGGAVTGADAIVASSISSIGEVNVDGPSSLWDSSGTLTVGGLGAGTLNITNQGVVESVNGIIGSSALGGTGTVNVNGTGSRWLNTNILNVGSAGTGTLNITGGGTAQNNQARVGNLSSATGTVTVDGIGSVWDTSTNDIFVGHAGEGTMSITDGATVKCVEGTIGFQSEGTNHVIVDGVGSRWEYSGGFTSFEADPGANLSPADLTVGDFGNGTLEITNGGRVLGTNPIGFAFGWIGARAGSTGYVRVSGPGSRWESSSDPSTSGQIVVGVAGHGTLEITDGGLVQADFLSIGSASNSTGIVTVDGVGSLSFISGDLVVGDAGDGALEIRNSGSVVTALNATNDVIIADQPGSMGTVTIDNSILSTGPLHVGQQGIAEMNITAGGTVFSGTTRIAYAAGSGTVTVAGTNSDWIIDGRLAIGGDFGTNGGTGTLRIQPGGTVASQEIQVFGGDLLSLEGGTLTTPEIKFVDGGDADTNFEWTSGTLHVGTYNGDLVIPNGGTLAPGNSAGTTTIEGDLALAAGGTLEIEIGGTDIDDDYDVVEVDGFAALVGNLELTLIDGFVPSADSEFFILIAADGVIGELANVANGQRLTTSDGLGSFLVRYGTGSADQILLSDFLAAAIPGDYNQDGTVNAADYTVWRDHLGQSFTLTNENPAAATPGVVDAEDYAFWKSNFGDSLGSGSGAAMTATVPEPRTVLLLMLAATGWCVRRGRAA